MSKTKKAVPAEFTTLDRQHLATVDPQILGERIRRARIEKRLSQRALATDLFTSVYLSTLELGKARPTPATLATLAERLDKPLDYFIHPIGEGGTAELTIEQDQLIQTKLLLLQAQVSLAGAGGAVFIYQASQKLAEVKTHLGRLSTNERAWYFYLSGLAFIRQGEYKLALADLAQASQLLPVILSKASATTPFAALELTILVEEASGSAEHAQKRFTSALSHYRQALELADPLSTSVPTSTTGENEIEADTITQAEQSLMPTQPDIGLDTGLGWKLHLELADTYVALGEMQRALEHSLAGLTELEAETVESGASSRSVQEADRLLLVAQLYQEQTDYTNALFYLGRSSQLYEQGANQKQLAELHNNLAKLQLRAGNYPAATRTAQVALRLARTSSATVSGKLTLARAYLQAGETGEADQLLSELLQSGEASTGIGSESELQLELYSLGAELALARGERNEAEDYYNQALSLLTASTQEQAASIELASRADFYYSYGQQLRKWGEIDRAFLYLDKALQLRQGQGQGGNR